MRRGIPRGRHEPEARGQVNRGGRFRGRADPAKQFPGFVKPSFRPINIWRYNHINAGGFVRLPETIRRRGMGECPGNGRAAGERRRAAMCRLFSPAPYGGFTAGDKGAFWQNSGGLEIECAGLGGIRSAAVIEWRREAALTLRLPRPVGRLDAERGGMGRKAAKCGRNARGL